MPTVPTTTDAPSTEIVAIKLRLQLTAVAVTCRIAEHLVDDVPARTTYELGTLVTWIARQHPELVDEFIAQHPVAGR